MDQSIEAITGMTIEHMGKKEKLYIPYYEESEIFNYNNGVLAFINKDGRMFTAPLSTANFQALENADYKQDMDLIVPFSNGEYPFQQDLKEKWDGLIKSSKN